MSELPRNYRSLDGEKVSSPQLSSRDLSELQRILGLLTADPQAAVKASPFQQPKQSPSPIQPQNDRALHAARAVVSLREARKYLFASSLFGEPAWDMLLILYVSECEGERLTVTRLAQRSNAPLTTAIRWIDYLSQSRLIMRRPHPHDARIVFVELTQFAREKMQTYFEGLIEGGHIAV